MKSYLGMHNFPLTVTTFISSRLTSKWSLNIQNEEKVSLKATTLTSNEVFLLDMVYG